MSGEPWSRDPDLDPRVGERELMKRIEELRRELAAANAKFDLLNEFYTCDANEEPDTKLAENTKRLIEENMQLRTKVEHLSALEDMGDKQYRLRVLDELRAENAKLSAEVERLKSEVQPEICICAAVKTPSGIFRGYRHGDCFAIMQRKGIPRSMQDTRGFITSKNRFVTRREGRVLQDKAGIPSASPDGYEYDTLFSEDLY